VRNTERIAIGTVYTAEACSPADLEAHMAILPPPYHPLDARALDTEALEDGDAPSISVWGLPPAAPAERHDRRQWSSLGYSLVALMLAELYGIAVFLAATFIEQHSATTGSGEALLSALVLLPIGLIVGEVLCAAMRAWLGLVLLPLALLSGVFVGAYLAYAL
jgi:hypothetical protein